AVCPVIWECACGEGHLSKVLEKHGYDVISTDLIYRGFGSNRLLDFLKESIDFGGDIITNPPYKYALEFVEQALNCVHIGRKVAMFLKLQFLEGKRRKEFFQQNPPKKIYVSSFRLICAMNGEFSKYPSSAIAYAWFCGKRDSMAIPW
ncbi:MAG TPA: conjugal transfer protein, partial [Lachnospiraceae bacterium]|nr:conjugal transfer protein [Lachnospiraceae bacterium]